jgi:hypothetical protein
MLRIHRPRFSGSLAAAISALAAVLLVCVAAWMTHIGRSSQPLQSHRAVEAPHPGAAMEQPPAASPLKRPAVRVELADDQPLLAVQMPTRNKNVTVVWMYPTVQ